VATVNAIKSIRIFFIV